MRKESVYLYSPILVFALGTKDLKSSLLTGLLTGTLLFNSFLFKKILKNENWFFVKFFIFSLQIALMKLVLDYFAFDWYLTGKYVVLMLYSIYLVVERVKIKGKLTKIAYIMETLVMIIIIGVLREFLCFGSLFSIKLLNSYDGILVFNYTSGGFFTATMLLAVYSKFKQRGMKNATGNN